jgi:hypothetical protein
MSIKQRSMTPLITLAAGLAFLLAACDFVMASNPSPASSVPQAGQGTSSPAVVPTPTPDLQPTIDAIVQQRIAEILTPPPQFKTRPVPEAEDASVPERPTNAPTPILVQFATPLPVDNFQAEYYRSGFACTGSMRPTIDCGDEGVFLKPPFQEPLMVGDVISFSPDESCRHYKNHNVSKAHRIIAVRVEGGTSFYTTQGDAASAPDPCEVTIEQIDGKLVEIKKGVRPQDIIDTSEYDLAKERVRLLKAEYEGLRASYDQSKAEYDAQGEEYQLLLASYEQGHAGYQEVLEFHQGLEEQRVALNRFKDDLNSLGEEINSHIDEVDRIYEELFIP